MRVRFYMERRKHGRSGHEIGRKKHIAAAREELLRTYHPPAVYVTSWVSGDMRGFEFDVGPKRDAETPQKVRPRQKGRGFSFAAAMRES